MTPPAATPPPELATAVRAGRWEDVRAATADLPRDLTPAVALAAARAERRLGQGERALALLDAALPAAGALAPALRLEAAEAALALGRDPLHYLSPLFDRGAGAGPRRAAVEVLRAAWESLPLPTLRRHRQAHLDRRLWRELDALLAVRGGSRAEVRRLLANEARDGAALRLARWVEALAAPTAEEALTAAEALLANGWWREAETLLARCPPPSGPASSFRRTYLEARAAYRLGRYAAAAAGYDRAIAQAPGTEELHAACVQRARVAELEGDWPTALAHWQRARAAAPREVEGWDGSTRLLAALGRPGDAVALARTAPAATRRVFASRLAATLLARGEPAACRDALALLPAADPAAATVSVALELAGGHEAAARSRLASLLADRRAGAWRDLALALPSPADGPPPNGPAPAATPAGDAAGLAAVAAAHGVVAARRALDGWLAAFPDWDAVLSGEPLPVPPLAAPVAALVAVGLEEVAARLHADAFPGATPAELAWSADRLAAWGNLPAALSAGEQLWRAAGEPPATLLPDRLLARLAPPGLTRGCVAAAADASVPAAWLAAVVRRESRFAAAARSSAGALGIAQIVPETARGLGAEPEDVLAPETGLRLAAAELARLRERFPGRLLPAAAAYNAGGVVVAAWLNLLGEDATEVLFAAAVPYGETAAYARAVHEGVQLFRHLDMTAGAPFAGTLQRR